MWGQQREWTLSGSWFTPGAPSESTPCLYGFLSRLVLSLLFIDVAQSEQQLAQGHRVTTWYSWKRSAGVPDSSTSSARWWHAVVSNHSYHWPEDFIHTVQLSVSQPRRDWYFLWGAVPGSIVGWSVIPGLNPRDANSRVSPPRCDNQTLLQTLQNVR